MATGLLVCHHLLIEIAVSNVVACIHTAYRGGRIYPVEYA